MPRTSGDVLEDIARYGGNEKLRENYKKYKEKKHRYKTLPMIKLF